MRIIRDILPMKPDQEIVEEIKDEVSKYEGITNPFLEHFVSNNIKNCLNHEFHDLCVRTYMFLSEIFTDSIFQKWKEKRVLKQIQIKNEKDRKLKIRNAVRSYKSNLEKFNFENTCFEKAGEDFQKDSVVEIYSREQHKSIKNRNIERHWKNG